MMLGLFNNIKWAYYQVRLIIKWGVLSSLIAHSSLSKPIRARQVRWGWASRDIFPHEEAHPTWEAGEGEVEPANFQFQLSFDIAGSRGKLRVDQKTIVFNQLFLSLSLLIVSTYSVVWVFQLSLLQGLWTNYLPLIYSALLEDKYFQNKFCKQMKQTGLNDWSRGP